MLSTVVLVTILLAVACAVPEQMYTAPCDSHKTKDNCFKHPNCAYCYATEQCVAWNACENTPYGKYKWTGCGDNATTEYTAHSGWQLPRGHHRCSYYKAVGIMFYCVLLLMAVAPVVGVVYCSAVCVVHLLQRYIPARGDAASYQQIL
jgi:hypothetical protein